MTSDEELGEETREMFSPLDLQQVKDAVRELRASSPGSVLADLVDEKVHAIENGRPAPRLVLSPARDRRIFTDEDSTDGHMPS
jgi:hypothetical protein